MYYWIMLALAVIAEISSTISMKYAQTHSPLLGYIVMAVLISFSFFAFSRAIIKIPLAVSYAIWEGVGLLGIGIASAILFGEYLSTTQMFAIGLMMTGLLLVTFDKGKKTNNQQQESAPPAHHEVA